MVSTWGAWPQQPRQQQSHPSSSRVVAQARNRLQELLEEMRNEEVEDVNSNVPVGEWGEPPPAACRRHRRPPPPLASPSACRCAGLSFIKRPSPPPSFHNHPAATKLEWPSPLAVLRYPDPRLRAVNALVGVFDDSLRQLAAEMFEVMYQ